MSKKETGRTREREMESEEKRNEESKTDDVELTVAKMKTGSLFL